MYVLLNKLNIMDLTQIAITAITVLTTERLWKYLETRYKLKADQYKFKKNTSDEVQYRDDLKNRVRVLEALLAESSDEKDALRELVLTLTAEVNALRVKVEFLEKENQRLKNI